MIPTAATPEPPDLGHLLPADAWAEVVRGAEEHAARGVRGFGAVDRTILAKSHGGTMSGGPRLGVLHSAETPLAPGYAYSIAANWFATKAETSAHAMIDPAETIRMLAGNVVSYAVGPRANGFTYNVEQAGRASMTTEWVSRDGLAQQGRVAQHMREVRDQWGIPLRWATDAQIKAAAVGGQPQGWCTHDDVRRVLGGTTHTDPGKSYPQKALMAQAAGTPAPTPGTDDKEDPLMDAMIFRAAGTRAPVLLWNNLPVELYGAEEIRNLMARGIPDVWVQKATVEALAFEARANRVARGLAAVPEAPTEDDEAQTRQLSAAPSE